jgi:hypothetical protein
MVKPLKNHPQFDYSETEILNQLNKITSSELFSHSGVLSRFLDFIVKETINGRASELKEYTIGIGTLGKSVDFNPQIDAIVRIHAGRLRRLMNEYYSGPGLKDTFRIEMVKGTYVPMFRSQVIGLNDATKVKNLRPAVYTRSRLTLAVLPFRNLCPDNKYQFFADGLGEELTRIFSICQDISVVAHHSTRKYTNRLDDLRVIGAELGAH